jgi:hypothetical protein
MTAKRIPDPWERRKGEPMQAYQFFLLYRDMIQRSIARLTRLVGKKSPRSLEKLASKWEWRARAEAWDEEFSHRMLLDKGKAAGVQLEAMLKRHIQLGIGMQTAAAKDLQALVHKVEQANKEAKKAGKKHHEPVLTVTEMVRLAENGVNLERISRGQYTQHHKVAEGDDDTDLSGLDVKDLKLLKELKRKAGL